MNGLTDILISNFETIKIRISLDEFWDLDQNMINAIFFSTIYYSNIEYLTILINGGLDINIKDKYGNTALIIASYYGYKKCVKTLLYAKADPNIRNNKDISALDLAMEKGYTDIVKLLRRFGAEKHRNMKLLIHKNYRKYCLRSRQRERKFNRNRIKLFRKLNLTRP